MARTAVLTKEQIITGALAITNETGFDSLTIRAIAKQLGTSTAPIYTQFPTMELLYEALSAHVFNQLIESTQVPRTPDPFLNIGVGILAYVLENKGAYTHFFLSPNRLNMPTDKDGLFFAQMKAHPFLSILGDDRLASLLADMWVFTYGLSTMICIGTETNTELSYYANKLEQTGNKLIQYHLFSSGLYETYIQNIIAKISQHVNLEEVFKQ